MYTQVFAMFFLKKHQRLYKEDYQLKYFMIFSTFATKFLTNSQMYATRNCISFYNGKIYLRLWVVIYFAKLEYLIHYLNGEIIVCLKKFSCKLWYIS